MDFKQLLLLLLFTVCSILYDPRGGHFGITVQAISVSRRHGITNIVPTPDNYGSFVDHIKKAPRHNIRRGCSTSYICGFTDEQMVEGLREITTTMQDNNRSGGSQLLLNSKGNTPAIKGNIIYIVEELMRGIKILKNNTAAGLDDMLCEQIIHLGPKAMVWLKDMIKNILVSNKFPKLWCKSKVITILKPVKDSTLTKSHRPISLLCHMYKLLERMILNRLNSTTEHTIIKEQSRFRCG